MSVKFTTIAAISVMSFALTACETNSSSNRDSGVDSTPLETMAAGIWVDPNGCDHWILDDGVEGYMTPRFGTDGKPVCRAGAIPTQATYFERSLIGEPVGGYQG